MKTVITDSFETMSLESARIIADAVNQKPDALLCLPAGNTAIRTYEILAEMQEKGEVSFARARFVELDELLDMDKSQNFASFMNRHFYGPLGIRPEQVDSFDPDAADPAAECARMQAGVDSRGGVDIMVLGSGMNGHLGLNEPGSPWDSGVRVVPLSETTKTVSQKYFNRPIPLRDGVTQGMRQIAESKLVLLQIGESKKADIVREIYTCAPGAGVPASILRTLPQGVVVLDADAASKVFPAG